MEPNTEGLVPKIMSNVQISSEYAESVIKEVVEQKYFFKFHEHFAAGNEVGSGECHCSRAPSAREKLTKYKPQFKEVPFTCDCSISFDLHVPLSQAFQEKEVSLTTLLLIGDLDCIHRSSTSSSSPDHLGHDTCVRWLCRCGQ